MAKQQSFTYDVVLLNLTESDTSEGNSGLLLEAALREWGIRTCVTDEGGKYINGKVIYKGIEESRIALVVVTGNNYHASLSRSNLLACLLDYFRWNRLPIFAVYYVDRSQAQQDTSSLKILSTSDLPDICDYETLHLWEDVEAEEEAGRKTLEKLSKAMPQVSDLPGWDFNRNKTNILEFNSHIASQVYQKLNRAPLHVADYPVGLECRLKEVCSLLELTSSDSEFVYFGIYGDHGIGKSTLARVVYNSIAHLFEGSCFLQNVRENSTKHGFVRLQNMLLSEIVGAMDIQLENFSEGVSMIKHRLHQKKVLLVLDDVDSLEQLEALAGKPNWFGPGSKVIITTQNKHLLKFHGIEMLYEVLLLNHKDALELLSHMAFKHGKFNPRCTEILNQLVTYAAGLPLVLKKIGCYLYEKSVDEWENALSQFKRIPHNNIQRLHKIHDDASKEGDQRIFQETSRSDPEASHISLSVPEETPLNDTESSQTESNDGVTWQMDFQKWKLILVFVATNIAGLSCNFLSPHFKSSIPGWTVVKFFPIGLFVLAPVAVILYICWRQTISELIKCCICYGIFLSISVYSYFYDRAVDGKPGILSLVSNAMFALASLSMSKLFEAGFETGIFNYFLQCFIIQLLTTHWWLIFVAIFIGVPLFDWHFSAKLPLITPIAKWFGINPFWNQNQNGIN